MKKGLIVVVALAVVAVGGCAQIAPFHHRVGDRFDKYAEDRGPGVVSSLATFGGWTWHLTGNIASKVLGGGESVPAAAEAASANAPPAVQEPVPVKVAKRRK